MFITMYCILQLLLLQTYYEGLVLALAEILMHDRRHMTITAMSMNNRHFRSYCTV